MGRCGLVCDNTLAYEVATADGEMIRASAEEHEDLFWALKGGGGNFGVVTSIAYQLHPITTVISGMLLHPLARANEVLRFYRDFTQSGLPDELIVYAATLTTPDGLPVIAIVPAYCGGNLAEGERLLEPLRRFGPPIADLVTRMPYVALQQMLDGATPYGNRSYWKSNFVSELSNNAIDTFVHFVGSCPSPRSFSVLEHAHGAAVRVPSEATAFSMRKEGFDLVILSLWEDAKDDDVHRAWTREFYSAMHPWSAGAVYVNALSDDDGMRLHEAYGNNYARLCELKTKYDAGNRFRHNQNISPAAQSAAT